MSKFHVVVDLDLKIRWLDPPKSQVEKNRRAYLEKRLHMQASKISTMLEGFWSDLIEEAEKK